MSLSVYNVYGPPSKLHRKPFFDILFRHLGQDPLPKVVLGDLNLLPSRDRAIWSRLINIIDIQVLAPTTSIGNLQSPFTYHRRGYKSVLDRCFVPVSPLVFSTLSLEPVYFSDHMALSLSLSPSANCLFLNHHHFRDFHSWQMPTYIVNSKDFSDLVDATLKTVDQDFPELDSHAKWSLIKVHLKFEALNLHLCKQALHKDKITLASADLVSECAKEHPDLEIVLSLKSSLQKLHAASLRNSYVKLKTATLLNRESPTAFLFRGLKLRRHINDINTILQPGDQSIIVRGRRRVLDTLAHSYSDCFAERPTSMIPDILSLLESNVIDLPSKLEHIDPSAVEFLNSEISGGEVENALLKNPGSSATGPDGLGAPFYRLFWQMLVPYLLCFYAFLASSSLHQFFFQYSATALLVPIPKKKSSSHIDASIHPSIKDFRIISTINFDLRLLARILNNRLGTVLSSVLHPYVFAIRYRNINHSALIHFVATRHLPSTSKYVPQVVKADLSNAFDLTSILYLMRHFICLLGYHLTTRILFCLIFSRRLKIKLASMCSFTFSMPNGLLQGCPLSSTLYSIYMDPLMHELDRHVHGLPLGSSGLSIKSSSFVDDLLVGCRDFVDARSVFTILRSFQARTGSVFNMQKTFILHLKPPNTKFDRSFTSRNSNSSLDQKILGHFLLPSQHLQRKHQKLAFLSDIITFYAMHKHRSLSLQAKVRIINTMVISRLSYHCLFLSFPLSWISEFQRVTRSFLWSSMAHVGMAKLFLPRTFGGLGLINLRLYFALRRLRFLFSIREAFSSNPRLAPFLYGAYSSAMHITDRLHQSLSSLIQIPINNTTNLRYGSFVTLMCTVHQYSKLPGNYLSSLHSLYLRPGVFNFIFYLLHHSLPVASHLFHVRRMSSISITCPLCNLHEETIVHLFSQCPEVVHIIEPFLNGFGISLTSFLQCLVSSQWAGMSIKSLKVIYTLAFAIWKRRCHILFGTVEVSSASIVFLYNHQFMMDRIHLPSYIFDAIW